MWWYWLWLHSSKIVTDERWVAFGVKLSFPYTVHSYLRNGGYNDSNTMSDTPCLPCFHWVWHLICFCWQRKEDCVGKLKVFPRDDQCIQWTFTHTKWGHCRTAPIMLESLMIMLCRTAQEMGQLCTKNGPIMLKKCQIGSMLIKPYILTTTSSSLAVPAALVRSRSVWWQAFYPAAIQYTMNNYEHSLTTYNEYYEYYQHVLITSATDCANVNASTVIVYTWYAMWKASN